MNGWMGNLVGIIGFASLGAGAVVTGSMLLPIRQQSETTADALMVMSAVRQTGQAVAMARAVDGSDVAPGIRGVREMVEQGWLRKVPRNPIDPTPSGMAVVRPMGDRMVVGMMLSPVSRDVCDEISKRSGLGWPAPTSDSPIDSTGCVMTSSGPVAYEVH